MAGATATSPRSCSSPPRRPACTSPTFWPSWAWRSGSRPPPPRTGCTSSTTDDDQRTDLGPPARVAVKIRPQPDARRHTSARTSLVSGRNRRPVGEEDTMTRWGAVLAVSLAIVLAALDLTIVSVALPLIGADLAATPAMTQWVLLAYFLPMTALGIPGGRWMDRASLRSAFVFAVAGFGV